MRIGPSLAGATTLVIAAVATVVVLILASQERGRILDEKRATATTITELFAASVSAGIVFHDPDAVEAELANLAVTDTVVGAAAFDASGAQPIAKSGRALERDRADGELVTRDALVVTRRVVDRSGRKIGAVRVAFSLAREQAALAEARRSLVASGVVGIVAVVLLLNGLTMWRVVRPLHGLAGIADRIRGGDLGARADCRGKDEIATLAEAFNAMGDAIAKRDEALRSELEIAAALQTSILPRMLVVGGAEIAATMTPATEVGGDYYDVIPTPDGCWIGIGDVSGHGLGAGVVMLMLQAAVASIVRAKPNATPAEVECTVNDVLYENVRNRMQRRDHATLSILRYDRRGSLTFAGAHEDILVFRAESGEVEIVETPGTWVGAMADVSASTSDSHVALAPADVVVLYTDGITEARRDGEQFGLERLIDVVRLHGGEDASRIVAAISEAVEAWCGRATDDVSVVVLRHRGGRDGESSPSEVVSLEKIR